MDNPAEGAEVLETVGPARRKDAAGLLSGIGAKLMGENLGHPGGEITPAMLVVATGNTRNVPRQVFGGVATCTSCGPQASVPSMLAVYVPFALSGLLRRCVWPSLESVIVRAQRAGRAPKPFGLVLFVGPIPFFWPTTGRMPPDSLSVRRQNGSPKEMVATSTALARNLPSSQGLGLAETAATLHGEAARQGTAGRDWDMTKTETVGLPVHALLTADADRAADAVLDFVEAMAKDVVLVTFANPGVVPLARRSASFRRSLREFDLVLPDGIGLCVAMRWLHGLSARRVSFDTTSLAPALFARAQCRGLRIVLVGGAPRVAEQARAQITAHFPGIKIIAAYDGYGDMAAKAGSVSELRPDIVICGMGSVRQEAFLLELKQQGWRGWGFTCGGYLDQLIGGIAYYPRWVDAANLRWAYRLLREPGRLWRRYFIDYPHFGALVLAASLRKPRLARA